MKVTPIKTPLVKQNDDLFSIIKGSVKTLPENSVLVVTSKIISYCQGRIVKKTSTDKEEKHSLVRKEADLFLDPHLSKYQTILTIKNNTLAVNAGLDESNANNCYVLWPEYLPKTTNDIWRFLREVYKVKKIGVIIADSKTIPLRWGVVGTALSHCGFKALYDYRGQKDLFDRKIKMSQINIAEAVAAAAALEMGEVAERTPLCLVEDIKKIEFQNRPPTKQELKSLRISTEEDIYGPLLSSVKWKK
jgi:putative folate metabolism gamma-glutamate ligase